MHLYLRRILIRDAATQSILCGIDLAVTQRDRDLTANEIGFILEVAAIFVMAMNRPREVELYDTETGEVWPMTARPARPT